MSSSIKVIKEQNIIDLENIVVQFPSRDGSLFGRKKFTAVNNVSLGIKAGETIGLVGESGCGKSTLANVIIGLLKPTSGLVKFNGLQMQYGSSEARKQFGRQVSVIFQDPATALNPRMKVLDILRDPMDIHNVLQPHEREKRVYDLLSRVGLPRSAAQVEPTRLSGGQKQRVAIARALALNPKLIVADEPMDARTRFRGQTVSCRLKSLLDPVRWIERSWPCQYEFEPRLRVPYWPIFLLINPTAASNAASISKSLVSSKSASAAIFIGAAVRPASRSSRETISASTSS